MHVAKVCQEVTTVLDWAIMVQLQECGTTGTQLCSRVELIRHYVALCRLCFMSHPSVWVHMGNKSLHVHLFSAITEVYWIAKYTLLYCRCSEIQPHCKNVWKIGARYSHQSQSFFSVFMMRQYTRHDKKCTLTDKQNGTNFYQFYVRSLLQDRQTHSVTLSDILTTRLKMM